MKKNREEIIAKLNKLSKGKTSQWIDDAQYRADNQEWLVKSQAVALKILRKLRENKANGVLPSTQVELAEQLGVSPQQVNKWVKGKENFTLETISKLEKVLGVSLLGVTKTPVEILTHKSLVEKRMYSKRVRAVFKKKASKTVGKIIPLYQSSIASVSNNKRYAQQS